MYCPFLIYKTKTMDKSKTLNLLEAYKKFKHNPTMEKLDALLDCADTLRYSINQLKSLLKYEKLKRYPTKEDYEGILKHWVLISSKLASG